MPRKLSDEELAARCTCGVPIDRATEHQARCAVAQRARAVARRAAGMAPYTAVNARERDKRQAAGEIAEQFAAGRAYLASGGRPLP